MKKAINFVKEKYKIFIPIVIVLGLLMAIFFLYQEKLFDNTRDKSEVSVYQYIGGIKYEYTTIITRDIKSRIVGLSAKDKNIEYDSLPVYLTQEEIILPKEMTVAFPLKEGSQYRTLKYARVFIEDDVIYIDNNSEEEDKYSNFFMYDGESVFVFPGTGVLKVDGDEVSRLGQMSYVLVDSTGVVIYYDTENDVSEVLELGSKVITYTSDNWEVNLSERYFLTFGKKVLLFSPDKLNILNTN